MVNHIAIIPARGGSKRIPKKNIYEICGKPMIAWTIEAALQSNSFTHVVVSTDDPEIREISLNCGASVPFLRDSATDDITPASEATIYALQQSSKHFGIHYEYVTQLMANCPARTASDITKFLQSYFSHKSSSQLSAFKFGWMNPWWSAKLRPGNSPEWLFPHALISRSQDLDDLYCPTGAIWTSTVESLLNCRSFYSPDLKLYPLSWQSSVDIDDYDDLSMAKYVLASISSPPVTGA